MEVIRERSGMSLTDSPFAVEYFRSDSFRAEDFPQVSLLYFAGFHQVLEYF